MTTTTTATIRIPLPAGAVSAKGWKVNADETVSRVFFGETHVSGAADIVIVGEQSYRSGAVLNCFGAVRVNNPGGDFDAPGLRKLAAIALAAAEELEALLSDGDGTIER